MMPDRDKVIKGLETIECNLRQRNHGLLADFCGDAISLLKEQEVIVRCKDCAKWDKSTMKHYEDVLSGSGDTAECRMFCDMDSWGEFTDDMRRTDGNWFCGDGERAENARCSE